MLVSVWLLYIHRPYDYVHVWRHFMLPVCPTVASSEVFLAPTPHSNSYCIFSKHSFWIWNTLLNLCFIVEVMKLLFDFYLRCLSHSPGNPFCMSKPHVPIWHPPTQDPKVAQGSRRRVGGAPESPRGWTVGRGAQGPSVGTPQPPPSWTQPRGGCPTSGHLTPLQQNLPHIEAVKGPLTPGWPLLRGFGGGCVPQPCLWLSWLRFI